jgi:hypothetical protein
MKRRTVLRAETIAALKSDFKKIDVEQNSEWMW